MNSKRKIFRIEATNGGTRSAPALRDRSPGYDHIIAELKALQSLVQPREELTERMVDSYKAQIAEAQKLKAELDIIQEVITRTKHEIATLHVTGFEGPEMSRVTHELDAIVGGDDAVAGAWLRNRNTVLDGEPIALIQTVPGLMNVIQYLDARRAVV